MGTTESKPNENPEISSISSYRRSSKSRNSSKADQIQIKADIIYHLKGEIDIFAGNRTDTRYKDFAEILAKTSRDVEMIKRRTSKQHNRDRCDQVLGDVQNCFQRLEAKVIANERNNLDSAAVESHSFINHNFNRHPQEVNSNSNWSQSLPRSNKQTKQPKNEYVKSLEDLEQQTQGLEKELRGAIDLEDTKQLKGLENKVKVIYGDLVMLNLDENTPLSSRKEEIEKRLVKCNNQVRKAQRKLAKSIISNVENDTPPKPSKNTENQGKEKLDELTKIELQLTELELSALTFEGIRNDQKYKELEQILESLWTKLYSADVIGEEERNRRNSIVEHAKKILQELRRRAEENEDQKRALEELHKIENEMESLKETATKFQGTSNDPIYVQLDQETRRLWAQLSQIEEPNEDVKRNKTRVISEIQDVLKNLSQDSKKRESQVLEDIQQTQLLKQVREFQIHWEQLNHNLSEKKFFNSDASGNIIEIFEKILEGLKKKTTSLSNIEKRKSSTSLVKVKLYDNTEEHAKYQAVSVNVPSASPQQMQLPVRSVAEPVHLEIKVQPGVKAIGEMQKICSETKALLQEIRRSNFTKQDPEYANIKAKLEQSKTNLDSIEYNKKSDTIEGNRRRASKMINEALRALEEKPSREAAVRSSRAQELMDIDAEIQYWHQQIKNFDAVTKNKQYEKIKAGLSDSLRKLQIINEIHVPKQDSIRQIQHYHQELETKLAENQAKVKISAHTAEMRRQTSQEIKSTVEQVQKLRSKVERFSGVYCGLLYKQIEGDLKSCYQKINSIDSKGDEKLQNATDQTQQKIQKYLRILEEKATKSSTIDKQEEEQKQVNGRIVMENVSYQRVYSSSLEEEQSTPIYANHQSLSSAEQTKTEEVQVVRRPKKEEAPPHVRMNTLRDKLVVIQEKTREFSGAYKDNQYTNIEAEIAECMEELKNIQDGGHRSIIISKEQYADYIVKLLQYFEEKTTTPAQEEATNRAFVVTDPMEELDRIEIEINQLKSQTGRTNSNNLEEDVNICISKLEKIEPGNVMHVRERKRKLLKDLEDCKLLVKQKTDSSAEELEIRAILQNLSSITERIQNFLGFKNDKDYSYLDEILIGLMIQLDNVVTHGNEQADEFKKTAIQEVQKYMRLLTERAEYNQNNVDSISSLV